MANGLKLWHMTRPLVKLMLISIYLIH